MAWKEAWDSIDLGLKDITKQLLRRAGGGTSEVRSGFSFGEQQLQGAVAHLAFLVLYTLLDLKFSEDHMDLDLYQEMRVLIHKIDLSEERQMLDSVEEIINLLLHLASIKVPTCDILSILDQEVAQGNKAMSVFFPDTDVLSVYSSMANTDVIQLFVLSLYHTTLEVLSLGLAFPLVSKVLGRPVGAVSAGQDKNGIFSISPGEQKYENSDSSSLQKLNGYNVAAATAKGNRLRAEFLKEAQLTAPPVMRVIDCQATYKHEKVILRDWKDCAQEVGYSAISHTYGQEVYSVFNCKCTAICLAEKPRCCSETCPHDTQHRVVSDILNMCAILREAGVDYAWHDGVCIAQHDEGEVKETIEHIGWIYSNASETIIFLHYVGKPIAPIGGQDCRWHTRVWTLQEAALSKCRRYCIRVGTTPIGACDSLQEFERKVALWYDDDFSKVAVVEEERFFEILKSTKASLVHALGSTRQYSVGDPSPFTLHKFHGWCLSVNSLIRTLQSVCFNFPTIDEAIKECSTRQSKHRGDRINSILALAKVKGFVAAKDDNVEASTIEFFKRQGQTGLAKAVFTGQPVYPNASGEKDHRKGYEKVQKRKHSWPPILSGTIYSGYEEGVEDVMRFKVLGDGKMELTGCLVCIEARFVVKAKAGGVRDAARELELKVGAVTYVPLNVVYYEGDILGSYKVTLSEAPAYRVGTIVLPFLPAPQLPRAGGPTIHEGLLLQEDEQRFDAFLVLPGAMDKRFYHALVVRGNPRHEVSKIGLFRVNASFHDHIRTLRCIRCPLHALALDRLVIL